MDTDRTSRVEPVLPTSTIDVDSSRPISGGRRSQDRPSSFIHFSTMNGPPQNGEGEDSDTFVMPMDDDLEILFR